MAINALQPEKLFLIKLAVNQFNTQYSRNIIPEKCTIWSIPADYGTQYGYEITTDALTDYVRLRIYLNVESRDSLNAFRLETDQTMFVKGLGDEVYVAMGTLSHFYQDAGLYKFRYIAAPAVDVEAVSLVSGENFLFMSGEQFDFVGG